jgi:hypothetical protein
MMKNATDTTLAFIGGTHTGATCVSDSIYHISFKALQYNNYFVNTNNPTSVAQCIVYPLCPTMFGGGSTSYDKIHWCNLLKWNSFGYRAAGSSQGGKEMLLLFQWNSLTTRQNSQCSLNRSFYYTNSHFPILYDGSFIENTEFNLQENYYPNQNVRSLTLKKKTTNAYSGSHCNGM